MATLPVTNLSSYKLTLPGGLYVDAIDPGETVNVTVQDVDSFVNNPTIQSMVDDGLIRIKQQSPVPYFVDRVSWGGGGTSTTVTVPGASSSDAYVAVVNTSTTAVSVVGVNYSDANTVTVTFSADPGANTEFTLVAYAL